MTAGSPTVRAAPEFLNRLDEIVFYKPLTKENIRGIVDLLVADLQKRMAQRQLTVTLTDAAKDYLIAKGYDPIYGARPLKRLIQTEVETLLARPRDCHYGGLRRRKAGGYVTKMDSGCPGRPERSRYGKERRKEGSCPAKTG